MRLLIILALFYFAVRAIKSWIGKNVSDSREMPGHAGPEGIDDIMVQDPVCKKYFPRREGLRLRRDGEVYYFCSAECRDMFPGGQKEGDR